VFYANGDWYQGYIKDGKREGWGWLMPDNGGRYIGLFKNEKLEGAVCYQKVLPFKTEYHPGAVTNTRVFSSAYEYFIFENNIRGEPSTRDEHERQ